MATQELNVWPKTVRVASAVGIRHYRHDNDRPCCAYGHFWSNFELDTNTVNANEDFIRAYTQVFAVFSGSDPEKFPGVIWANDHDLKNQSDRTLVYNATMARLGYIKGQDRKAIALAAKTAKRFGEFQFRQQ